MTFLKKSVFDPPNRQYLFSQAYLGDLTLSTYHFLTISGPHAKSHKRFHQVSEIVKVFAPWILS